MIITSLESAAIEAVSNDGGTSIHRTADPSSNSKLDARILYERLLAANAKPDAFLKETARTFIEKHREESRLGDDDALVDPGQLKGQLQADMKRTGARYQEYLVGRKAGGPRQYFTTRSHALHFLRAVAPTKLVDGVWLYGLLRDASNPHFSDLFFTYIEELGDGDPDKNHVLIYRRLLDSLGIVDWPEQPAAHYAQGALQLALASCTDAMLPEIIGFNLGYEQLPLHLLITSYELDELGIDSTYFSLHVTVDNAMGGHAHRALRAATEAMPAIADPNEYWRRVQDGYRLSMAGWGTTDAIRSFDARAELVRVIENRALEGQSSHSDYCRIEGKTVNEWLSIPGGASEFIDALERKGWLQRGSGPSKSRFWNLLQGEAASMFGVFGDYEMQVIYDWIRGDAASDGAAFTRGDVSAAAPRPARPFRHSRRLASAATSLDLADLAAADPGLDPDVIKLRDSMKSITDRKERGRLLDALLGPAFHWTPAGLEATRHVSSAMRAVS
jgi:hypothetical protein